MFICGITLERLIPESIIVEKLIPFQSLVYHTEIGDDLMTETLVRQ
jgi:hypothetical protein